MTTHDTSQRLRPESRTPRRTADHGRRNLWALDAVIAAALALVALGLRHDVPPDGFFYDDAWQAFGAIKGSFGELLTVGLRQPVFAFVLMAWSRVAGGSTASMVTPALIAGTLGPPALYLTLRWHRFARSVSLLLGAVLTVCETHVIYSSRAKPYTLEVLVVLLLAVVVPWLASRRWQIWTAVAWFVGSIVLAAVSAFAMLGTIAAGIIFVLRPRQDRRLRMVSVALQALGVAALVLAENRSFNPDALDASFAPLDAYIVKTLNPITLGREIFHHLTRITTVFPGGPGWLAVLTLVLASIGLGIAMLRGGRRSVTAQFMLAMVVLAIGGAIAQRVPFAPNAQAFRLTLWLIPVVAFGLAVVLQRTRRLASERGSRWKLSFDLLMIAAAVAILVSGVGADHTYPVGGSAEATHDVMQRIGPRDAVLVMPTDIFSFALAAETPVRLIASPKSDNGIAARFADPRIHNFTALRGAQLREIQQAVAAADRVFVIDSHVQLAAYTQLSETLAQRLEDQQFVLETSIPAKQATVFVWRRK